MNSTFFDGHDELYHHAKFGGRSQMSDRTKRNGYRCENVFFTRAKLGTCYGNVAGWLAVCHSRHCV